MDLHGQIMNIRVAPTELATSLYAGDTGLAYKIGHRDARHAAAELALAAGAEIERLRAALEFACEELSGYMNLPITNDRGWIDHERDDIAKMDKLRQALGKPGWLVARGFDA